MSDVDREDLRKWAAEQHDRLKWAVWDEDAREVVAVFRCHVHAINWAKTWVAWDHRHPLFKIREVRKAEMDMRGI